MKPGEFIEVANIKTAEGTINPRTFNADQQLYHNSKIKLILITPSLVKVLIKKDTFRLVCWR